MQQAYMSPSVQTREAMRNAPGVLDAEKLRSLLNRIRAIGSDCFDLGAAERLRMLADEVEKTARSGR